MHVGWAEGGGARTDNGPGEREVARLGHCTKVARAWRRIGVFVPGRSARKAGTAAGRAARLRLLLRLRRIADGSARSGFRNPAGTLGDDGFPRSRDRLFG